MRRTAAAELPATDPETEVRVVARSEYSSGQATRTGLSVLTGHKRSAARGAESAFGSRTTGNAHGWQPLLMTVIYSD
jgi:hypothetical protein